MSGAPFACPFFNTIPPHHSYRNDPEIMAMTNLVNAYQQKDIKAFEDILRKNKKTIMSDPFIQEHIDSVRRTVRIHVLTDLILPYQRILLSTLAKVCPLDLLSIPCHPNSYPTLPAHRYGTYRR